MLRGWDEHRGAHKPYPECRFSGAGFSSAGFSSAGFLAQVFWRRFSGAGFLAYFSPYVSPHRMRQRIGCGDGHQTR